jgi:hypothetical protein
VPSTLTVQNNLDSGAGSLRAALTAAHNGNTIVFAPGLASQTITLTGGELLDKVVQRISVRFFSQTITLTGGELLINQPKPLK